MENIITMTDRQWAFVLFGAAFAIYNIALRVEVANARRRNKEWHDRLDKYLEDLAVQNKAILALEESMFAVIQNAMAEKDARVKKIADTYEKQSRLTN